jgi:hypothetical protein
VVTLTRNKVSMTHKTHGIKPRFRGGNGKLTLPQIKMLDILGPDWNAEHVIVTQRPRPRGVAKNYKIDVANPALKIAIELDGRTHAMHKIREADQKQTQYLLSIGWCVLRLSNATGVYLCTICKSKDILLTTLMEYLHTNAT